MTITVKIDNPDVEKQLQQLLHEQKEITFEMLSSFFTAFQRDEPMSFPKKDPRKHTQVIPFSDDDGEDLSNVKPYAHIEDSARYVHDLRRKSV